MHPDKRKEQSNIAYMRALAAHAGLKGGGLIVDDDSIDMLFQGEVYKTKVRSLKFSFSSNARLPPSWTTAC